MLRVDGLGVGDVWSSGWVVSVAVSVRRRFELVSVVVFSVGICRGVLLYILMCVC